MAIRLGLDASQPLPSCAVSTGLGIVSALSMDKPIENFSVLIRKTLFQAHVTPEDLDEIVVCIGPGSQMGARTAVVTGNALALALDLPVSGILSSDALAILTPVCELVNIAVSDGRGRWYMAAYTRDGDKLQRLDALQLVNEIPPDNSPVFRSDSLYFNEEKLCAHGLLMIADQQRHLITQSLVREISPYEGRGNNGIY